MTKSKTTKRALMLSVLSMLLCVAMLTGSTFAWFTDSVVSGNNKIVAGNLDVELYHSKDAELGDKVNPDTMLFTDRNGDPIKWEPGVMVYENFTVKNAGSLALKFRMTVNSGKIDTVTVDGEQKSLKDVLKIAVVEGAFTGNRDDVRGLTYDYTLDNYAAEDVELGAGDEKTYAVVIYWEPTDHDNDFNLNNGKRADKSKRSLSIELGVTLVATQATIEEDSFDNWYDKDADYPVVSEAELTDRLQNAQAGDKIAVLPGTYSLPDSIPEGVTIFGEDADSTVLRVPKTTGTSGNTGLVIANSGVTIRNADIRKTSMLGGLYTGYIDIREGNTTLDGLTIDAANWGEQCSAVVIGNGVDEGETVRIANSTLESNSRTLFIVDGANGTVEIDNTEITGIYTFNVNSASSQNLVINVTNSKLHGWTSYGDIKSASFSNTEFSKGGSSQDYLRPYADTTLTNCTFDSGFKMGSGDGGNKYTFIDCTYDGQKLTAENIKDLMLDKDDEANLRKCVITVDGITVTY